MQLSRNVYMPHLKSGDRSYRLPNDQLMNRIDAFLEMLETKAPPQPVRTAAGIDSSSTSTNAVIIDAGKRILSY